MWKFKSFMPKEQTGLEGRTIDIGNLKVHVRNAIAEGGFSSVYLARDAVHGSKQYALKHIICNDKESLELVMKEISVMKLLRGHPNVVTLCAHSFLDMGRTKEALLVMEYCEKSLVNVLENRGASFFEEKQILTIFRDVCNAVFAMHCLSPPIAHRDLKAENLLLGSDGLWKLCDFGSTSTNHKRFEKPEEMGIEEDNIRKYTTPAYRAPEMWDLFRRELINEKVDIWALGCLLYRICYLKSAFDGESKLQVLNGNYRIPELPKYSTSVTDLIRDMLQSSPDARPDITQVWFCVNNLLPDGLQKSLPDRPPEIQQQGTGILEGITKPSSKSNPMPRRNPPPPPVVAEPARNASATSCNSKPSGSGDPLGAFWTTQHAKESSVADDKSWSPKLDEKMINHSSRHDRSSSERLSHKTIIPEKDSLQLRPGQNNVPEKSFHGPDDGSSKDFEANLFPGDLDHIAEKPKALKSESKAAFQSEAFNAFVSEFGSNKSSPRSDTRKLGKVESLEAEIEKLKEQLTQVNMEKAEMTSKYEKLSAICRSQRQEIQELKQALAVQTPSSNRDAFKTQASAGSHISTSAQQKEKIEGTAWELQQGLFDQISPSPDPRPWQAFPDEPISQASSDHAPRSVRTRNGHHGRQVTKVDSSASTWGFGTDNFRAVPAATSHVYVQTGEMNNSQRFGETKNFESNQASQNVQTGEMINSHRFGETENFDSKQASQPAGWAGF